MEDTTQLLAGAVVLGLLVTGLVKLANDLIEGDAKTRRRAGVCIGIGQLGTQLVAHSDFAAGEKVLGRTLDTMNLGSQVVVGVLVAGLAVAAWLALDALRNVGENQVKRPTLSPHDDNPTPK